MGPEQRPDVRAVVPKADLADGRSAEGRALRGEPLEGRLERVRVAVVEVAVEVSDLIQDLRIFPLPHARILG